MAKFNGRNQSGGNRNFGKPRFKSDRPDMHKATCSNCGKICEVPFRPTGSKPVFCKDCFKNNEGSDSYRSENRTFSRSSSEDRQMYDAVCDSCGNNCQVPFRPTPGREIFCSRCFEKNGPFDSRRPQQKTFDKPSFNRDNNQNKTNDAPNYKAQFEALNAKMDKILNLLTSTPIEVSPLIPTIDETVAENQKEKPATAEKKPKKTKALTKKPATKTEKTTPSKKN